MKEMISAIIEPRDLLEYLRLTAANTADAKVWEELFTVMAMNVSGMSSLACLLRLIQTAQKTDGAEVWRVLFAELYNQITRSGNEFVRSKTS